MSILVFLLLLSPPLSLPLLALFVQCSVYIYFNLTDPYIESTTVLSDIFVDGLESLLFKLLAILDSLLSGNDHYARTLLS